MTGHWPDSGYLEMDSVSRRFMINDKFNLFQNESIQYAYELSGGITHITFTIFVFYRR